MFWFRGIRIWWSLRTIRNTTGFGAVPEDTLAKLDPPHLRDIANVALRIHEAASASVWMFHLALPDLIANSGRATAFSNVTLEKIQSTLNEHVKAIAQKAIRLSAGDFAGAIPAGLRLKEDVAVTAVIEFLRQGKSTAQIGTLLRDKIRGMPAVFIADFEPWVEAEAVRISQAVLLTFSYPMPLGLKVDEELLRKRLREALATNPVSDTVREQFQKDLQSSPTFYIAGYGPWLQKQAAESCKALWTEMAILKLDDYTVDWTQTEEAFQAIIQQALDHYSGKESPEKVTEAFCRRTPLPPRLPPMPPAPKKTKPKANDPAALTAPPSLAVFSAAKYDVPKTQSPLFVPKIKPLVLRDDSLLRNSYLRDDLDDRITGPQFERTCWLAKRPAVELMRTILTQDISPFVAVNSFVSKVVAKPDAFRSTLVRDLWEEQRKRQEERRMLEAELRKRRLEELSKPDKYDKGYSSDIHSSAPRQPSGSRLAGS